MTLKLNLGAGLDRKEGYLNVDCVKNYDDKNYLVNDVTTLPNIADNSVDEIFARDVIEHIPVPLVEKTIRRWYKVLKTGGKLIIQTPNMLTIAHEILYGDQSYGMSRIFADSVRPEDWHKSGFTPETIKVLLESNGFKVCINPIGDLYYSNYRFNMSVIAEKI